MQLTILHLTQTGPGWWVITPLRFGVVLLITASFAGLGHVVRGVTRSGAIAGGIICFVLFASAGPGSFVALLSLFVVTWVATRLGRSRKQRLGTAERGEGRTASQVLANLAGAATCAVIHAFQGNPFWLLAMASALAEAASDTVSSEAGQAFSEKARLITTFKTVPAGTDGGISLAGTIAGVAAAFALSAVCVCTDIVPQHWLWIATVAGALGMLADSILGALFERRGWLTNDTVNFTSTLVAAGVVACLALFS